MEYYNIVITKSPIDDRETAQLMIASSREEAINTIKNPSKFIKNGERIHNEFIIADNQLDAQKNLWGKKVAQRVRVGVN